MFTLGKIYLHFEPEETQFSYSDNGDICWKVHVRLVFYLLSSPHWWEARDYSEWYVNFTSHRQMS